MFHQKRYSGLIIDHSINFTITANIDRPCNSELFTVNTLNIGENVLTVSAARPSGLGLNYLSISVNSLITKKQTTKFSSANCQKC